MNDTKASLEDMKKIAQEKSKHLEKELGKVQNELKLAKSEQSESVQEKIGSLGVKEVVYEPIPDANPEDGITYLYKY